MTIDLNPWKKALENLERAIFRAKELPEDKEIRDAVIQRFEYSYELCWKMLKRRLEDDAPNPAEIDRLSFRELIREGAEKGLVKNAEAWMEYREQRNITAHTYDEKKAESVFKTAILFFQDAKEYSDLDLSIMTRKPLEVRTMAILKNAFSETNLPIKVDVVDWNSASERIKEIIRREGEIIQPSRGTF